MAPIVERVITIELSAQLYARAAARFAQHDNVSVLLGDSGCILPGLLPDVDSPVFFWLDGHYSGGDTARGEMDTPIRREMDTILRGWRPGFVVLIDDVRLFTGENGYPTLDDITSQIARQAVSYTVRDDILRIVTATTDH